MVKYFLASIAVLFLLPMMTSAAYNTVTFTQDTNLYVWGLGVTVVAKTNSVVAGITVNSGNISLVLESGSDITLTASPARYLTNSVASTICGSSGGESSVHITSSITQTVTVTPGDLCLANYGSEGGGGGGDSVSPSISQIAVVVSSNQAVVTWLTDESATSRVNYGLTTGYGNAASSTSLVSSHLLTLTGLTASTTYHYQIQSTDNSGNTGSYTDRTFATLAAGATTTSTTPSTPVTSTKPISQMSVAELQVEIARITALIVNLQAELANLTGTTQSFAVNLYQGLKSNAEVKRLQEFLISKGYLVAGFNTGNYLSLTVGAVKAYQTAKAITPVSGYFGPKTRAAVNTDIGATQ